MPSSFFDDPAFLAAVHKGSEPELRLLLSEMKQALEAGDVETLREFLGRQHPADLMPLLQRLQLSEVIETLLVLPSQKRAEVFGYLGPTLQQALGRALPHETLVEIVSGMNADERVDFFNRLPEPQRADLLPALAQAKREDIRRLASYAEETAGAIMTSDYAALSPELTAAEAIERLRQEAPDKETIYRAYIVDDQRHLLGAIRLQTLILAQPDARLRDIMERHPKRARVDDDQEEVAHLIARYDLIALPIVDAEGRLVGIVTHDDALDVIHQEATEDIHKVGSIGRMITSVSEASVGTLYRRRIGWLILLVFGNLVSGAGIAYFEDTIAAYIALVFFLPLLVDSGGNAGSQSATLMVRALATGEVVLRDWARMIGREILVAGLLGLSMALAVSAVGVLRGGPEIALVVSSTMVLIVVVGSMIGLSLPFLLNRLRLDPATASAPLVTSICDAVGVVIYFAIATALLQMPAG